MLWKLLVKYLRPYRRLLAAVVVFQLAQSIASLYLPTLNADIIDEGVAKGDTGYILRVGGVMLLITFAQIVCSIIAVYFGAKAAMALGRDLRGAVFSLAGASDSLSAAGIVLPLLQEALLAGPPAAAAACEGPSLICGRAGLGADMVVRRDRVRASRAAGAARYYPNAHRLPFRVHRAARKEGHGLGFSRLRFAQLLRD